MSDAGADAPTRSRVLVTGVSGFIGRRLAVRLRSAGWQVRGSGRRPSDQVEASESDYVPVQALSATTEWHSALTNVDAVLHLASIAHEAQGADMAPYRRAIVEGSRRLAEQAAACGVRRLVFVSSVKAVGESTDRMPFNRATEPRPQDGYGVCKLEAERALAAVAARTELELVIVRPPLVYGPGVKGNFLRLLRWADRGVPLPLGRLQNARSLVYLDNLCDLLEVCLADPNAVGKALFVADGEDVSTPDLIGRIAAALGRRARLFPFPLAVLRSLAWAGGQGDSLRKLCGSLQVDAAETQHQVDWSPRVSLDQGIRETADWYRARA